MRFTKLLIGFVCAAGLLAGCGGGGGSPGTTGGSTGSGSAGNTALATTAPTGLTLKLGDTQTFSVSGGTPPYTVVSTNTAMATGSISGTALTITGTGPGTTALTIFDAKNTSVSVSVTVTVADVATTAPASGVTLSMGFGNAQTYGVSGGVAPYIATSSNTGVVTVSMPTSSSILINGVTSGAASIVIRDALGKTVTIPVTVATSQMSVNPATVSAFIGDTVYTTLSGGSAPYSIVQGFPDAADVSIGVLNLGVFTVNSAGNVLRIIVKQAVGTDSIVVRDSGNNTAVFTLTGRAGTNAINLSPGTITISGGTAAVNLTEVLYGGVGTVSLFSSDPALITVTPTVTGSSSGTTVAITRVASAGIICSGPNITITAIDSLGQTATSVISVAKPSTCP